MDENILNQEEEKERQKMKEEAATKKFLCGRRQNSKLQAANDRWKPTMGNRDRPEELWAFMMGRPPIKSEKNEKKKKNG